MSLRAVDISNSDKIINSLIDREYIYTSTVEKAIRAVSSKLFACKLRSREINSEPPCISATVLECLVIRPGHKFLNIGSRNGYFNTLAGLLLGSNGVNHGIEVDKALVDIAKQKMDDFKLNSAAIDYNVFCEPVFIHGNACELLSTSFYDRVYCRPGVPPEHIEFMKSLIKIGGVLVMPLNIYLVKITRIDELRFDTTEIFKVASRDLIVPEKSVVNKIEFPPIAPVSLKDLCRTAIRSLFHDNIIKEFPDMDIFTKCKIVSNPEKKMFGPRDNRSEYIRSRYNVSEEQIFNYRFPLNLSHEIQALQSINEISFGSGCCDQNNFHYDDTEYICSDSSSDLEDYILNPGDYNLDNGEKYDNNKLDGEEKHKNTNDKIINDDIDYDNKLDDREKDKVTDDTKIDHDNKLDNQKTGDNNKLDMEVGCSKDAEIVQDETIIYTSNEWTPEPGCSRSALEMENKKKTKTDSSTEESTSVPASPSTSPVAPFYMSSSVSVKGDESRELVCLNETTGSGSNLIENDDTDDKEYNDLIRYQFQHDCKKNKLSLLLKDKIYSLPLPASLMMYLNYNRSD